MELNKIHNMGCIEYMKTLPNESVDLVIADPPYNIATKKGMKGNSHGKIHTLTEKWDIFDSEQEYIRFSANWINEAKRVLKDNGSIFVWGNSKSIFTMRNCLEENGFYFRDMITWCKRDAPPNVTCRLYANSTEFVLWYSKGRSGWKFNHNDLKTLNEGRQMRNYWDISKSMKKDERTSHPTQKKGEVCDRIVIGHSNKGDVVYIPFAGSGSEIISCIKNNRNWISTEINNEYIEDIVKPRIASIEKDSR